MTDRYHSLTVILERDIREDDAQPLIGAIQMLRGVLSVQPHVANLETEMAQQRANQQLGAKLLDILYPKKQ
jgi:hypothetical protein